VIFIFSFMTHLFRHSIGKVKHKSILICYKLLICIQKRVRGTLDSIKIHLRLDPWVFLWLQCSRNYNMCRHKVFFRVPLSFLSQSLRFH
jgi:hypothetical protein